MPSAPPAKGPPPRFGLIGMEFAWASRFSETLRSLYDAAKDESHYLILAQCFAAAAPTPSRGDEKRGEK